MTLNWAGNLRYSAARVHTPSTLDELRRIVEVALDPHDKFGNEFLDRHLPRRRGRTDDGVSAG